MEKAPKYSGINGKSKKYEIFTFPFPSYGKKSFIAFSVLREQYYMVKKLGGGGFGTVYMVQV